ncbi:hypothetical protein M406DRAFT_68100 [Cryphonectria parasitica EP155]|uniref:Uncharacterized protein n=1 Tax=Cryphonectria parasitica (strain ATCC 38755 / EP155) TaxID=660469 RepID=A0A9P5CNP5_CRYP1|nr:uncharacterized protein M406DRAFT_68100 [Cryphonectria parasitica EP155]KAF3765679.1 hypothetical protein M406DRAFT_68100 [Cryphonectria parasitica EP155]
MDDLSPGLNLGPKLCQLIRLTPPHMTITTISDSWISAGQATDKGIASCLMKALAREINENPLSTPRVRHVAGKPIATRLSLYLPPSALWNPLCGCLWPARIRSHPCTIGKSPGNHPSIVCAQSEVFSDAKQTLRLLELLTPLDFEDEEHRFPLPQATQCFKRLFIEFHLQGTASRPSYSDQVSSSPSLEQQSSLVSFSSEASVEYPSIAFLARSPIHGRCPLKDFFDPAIVWSSRFRAPEVWRKHDPFRWLCGSKYELRDPSKIRSSRLQTGRLTGLAVDP